jgi:hypothetical protein
MSTLPEPAGLGNLADDLGSLAQSARTKQLKTARGILYAVGILTVVANAALVIFAAQVVDSQIESELKNLRAKHMQADPAEVARVREQMTRSLQFVDGIGVVIGVVFIACAIFVYKFPIATTVTSLVLYLGAAAVYGVLDPETLKRGWWLKILVAGGLFKAVQAALAYESERKAAAASAPIPSPQATLPEHLPLKF